MERYDYLEAVKNDVRNYIKDNGLGGFTANDRDTLCEELDDNLYIDDSVTGNASGSYTFNSWKAEEYLCHNTDLLYDALRDLCFDVNHILETLYSPESCDVIIRCHLLYQAVCEVVDELPWYAVMSDDTDDDWGTGSYNRAEAEEMLANDYPSGYIAVILNGICIEGIRNAA